MFEVTPADAGLAPAKLSDLKGGDEKDNAAAIRDVLAGKKTPLRDIAVLNAAAALIVAGKAANLLDGAALAAHSIESGAAKRRWSKLVAITNGRVIARSAKALALTSYSWQGIGNRPAHSQWNSASPILSSADAMSLQDVIRCNRYY